MSATTTPGRTCPLHYHYGPEAFQAAPHPDLTDVQVLYVVGGLYGNELALHQVLRLFEAETGRKRLVFNGDFHWFDVDTACFARIQREVMAHSALRGNVETELTAPALHADAGCGCAYPEWVGDAVVERSNRILARLWTAAQPEHRQQLAALPMWLKASVGGMVLGLVHGDAQSLAGWGFAQEHLRDPAHRQLARSWLARAGVDAFACTHTCLPVFQRLVLRPEALAHGWIFNNGSAGMPNFAGDSAGLLTRIATSPVLPAHAAHRRAGVVQGGVHVDALAIEVDAAQVQQRFLSDWPLGSDAHASYFSRIAAGPDYHPHHVVRLED